MALDEWLAARLRCPYEGAALGARDESLVCPEGHAFPVVRGVPVLLPADAESTHPFWWTTPADVDALRAAPPPPPLEPGEVEPFVAKYGVATCGLLYRGLPARLPRHPIPSLEALPPGGGRAFLDVGGNWGRWGLAASARGFRAVVVDPSLKAALAGQRIAASLAQPVSYVVADGRHLPFAPGSFAVSFSYSVLQHLEKVDARAVVRDMARVTERGGVVRAQMANVLGLRRLTMTLVGAGRDRFRRLRDPGYVPHSFRLRGWTPRELERCFEELVGPTTLSIDGFFSLNAQIGDVDLLRRRYAAVVHASHALARFARLAPRLLHLADSLYAEAHNDRSGARSVVGS